MNKWIDGCFASLDFETTGVNPKTAKVVECAMLLINKEGSIEKEFHTLVDPGIPIPPEASEVHGITDEKAKMGMQTKDAMYCISKLICETEANSWPLVIFNVPYDWCVLVEEVNRCSNKPILKQPGFVDPLLIDRFIDKYRKGSRTLTTTSSFYEISLNNAHTAKDDAYAAERIARAILKKYPTLSKLSLEELQKRQTEEFKIWKEGINRYWKKKGDSKEVKGEWPL